MPQNYYATPQQMFQRELQTARLRDARRNQQFQQRLQAQRLQQAYDSQAQNEQQRWAQMNQTGQHQRNQENIGMQNLEARLRAIATPHFGPTMEMEGPDGRPVTVTIDSKSGRIWNPAQQRWVGRVNVDPQTGMENFTGGLRRPIPLPGTERKRMGDLGGELQTLIGQAKSFKPEYTNSLGPQVGELENVARQYVPGMSSDMPNWWRTYKRVQEIPERHGMLGATLTARELADWKGAEINPGMKPQDVRRLMNVRAAILKMALDRAMLSTANRYNRREVEDAAGMSMPSRQLDRYPSQDEMAQMGGQMTGTRPSLDELIQGAQPRE